MEKTLSDYRLTTSYIIVISKTAVFLVFRLAAQELGGEVSNVGPPAWAATEKTKTTDALKKCVTSRTIRITVVLGTRPTRHYRRENA